MRYLMNVVSNTLAPATTDEMDNITAFNTAMKAKGQLVMAEGLADPSRAVVVDNRQGQGEVVQGPICPAPHAILGFWVIEVDSDDEALALAHGASKACNNRIELRSYYRED